MVYLQNRGHYLLTYFLKQGHISILRLSKVHKKRLYAYYKLCYLQVIDNIENWYTSKEYVRMLVHSAIRCKKKDPFFLNGAFVVDRWLALYTYLVLRIA